MKLMWIVPECPYPPNTGGRVGIWKRIFYMANNNDIYLYSIIDENPDEEHLVEMKKYCRDVKFYTRSKDIKTLLKSVKYPYVATSRWNKLLYEDLNNDFDKINPDFIIVDFPQMIGALPDKLLNSKKLILNQHNIEHQSLKSLGSGLRNPLKKIIYNVVAYQLKNYEKQLYKMLDIRLYTFVSTEDKKFFEQEYNKNNTLLVPVGAEIRSSSGNTESSHNLIFVGKMSYPANENAALWLIDSVMPIIKKSVPDAKLYLVGKDPGKKLIEKASEKENIVVTGTVESLDKYYDMTNVALVPIMTGGGVNVKLLEAIGQGKNVITTSKGVEGTVFEAGNHVLVADNTDTFAKNCIDVMLYQEKYSSMRRKAMKLVIDEYSWESIVKKFEMELRKIKNES